MKADDMQATSDSALGGRRDRNMRDKMNRIFRAAAELFAERGFTGVKTQHISDRADVAAGTLFRYASSKGELLLMVYNEEFRRAIEEGERAAADQADVVDAVFAMVAPVVKVADRTDENGMWYQRELMFGAPAERYRAEGLAQVARLEEAIARRISQAASLKTSELEPIADAAFLAARTVFAVVHLAALRASTGVFAERDALADVREQSAQIIAGYLESLGDAS